MTTRTAHAVAGWGWDAGMPACVRAGDWVFVGARMAVDLHGRVAAPGDVGRQTELALDALERALETVGASIADVVGILSFHADALQIEDALRAAAPRLGPDPPAWTPVMMTAAPVLGAVIAVSAIALVGEGEKQCLTPDTIAWWRRFPVPAGCRKGDLVVVSGQYGSDADGNVNTPGDDAGQTRNALNRVNEICAMLGGAPSDVIDLLSFHQDPRGISASAAVYSAEFVPGVPYSELPAWTSAGTPALYRLGMLAQFQAIADLSGSGRRGFIAQEGTSSERPSSGASGKVGGELVAVAAGVPSEAATRDPTEQANAAWDALEHALEGMGATTQDVAAITSFHKDIRDIEAVRQVILSRSAGHPPVWTPVGMTGFPDPDAVHSFRAIAVTSSRQRAAAW